nr:MAG TPA: hypothetical protein [Bacteriophage sp.]
MFQTRGRILLCVTVIKLLRGFQYYIDFPRFFWNLFIYNYL